MSRRSINAERAAQNPDWRAPMGDAGGTGAGRPILPLDKEVEALRDENANLRRDNARLQRQLEEALRGGRVRAPTQAEILAAISSAVAKTGIVNLAAPAAADADAVVEIKSVIDPAPVVLPDNIGSVAQVARTVARQPMKTARKVTKTAAKSKRR